MPFFFCLLWPLHIYVFFSVCSLNECSFWDSGTRWILCEMSRQKKVEKTKLKQTNFPLYIQIEKIEKKSTSVWRCLTHAQSFMQAVIVSFFPCLMNEAVAAVAVIEEILHFIRREMTCSWILTGGRLTSRQIVENTPAQHICTAGIR